MTRRRTIRACNRRRLRRRLRLQRFEAAGGRWEVLRGAIRASGHRFGGSRGVGDEVVAGVVALGNALTGFRTFADAVGAAGRIVGSITEYRR